MYNPSTIIIQSLITQALTQLSAATMITRADQSALCERDATQIDQLHTSLLFLSKNINRYSRAESRRTQAQED